MKKLLTITLALVLTLSLCIPVLAATKSVNALTACGTTETVTLSGTVTGIVAVMTELLDGSGNSLVLKSFAVSDGTFSGTITGVTLTAGATYTVRAADYDGGTWKTMTFTVPLPPVPATVATPTFSPAGGTFPLAQSVTISCATVGATIRYTTNGDEPTDQSPAFVAGTPISVSSTTTIKAKAFKDGMTASEAASAAYAITTTSNPDPTVYSVIEGGQGTWAKGSTNGLTIRVNGDYSKFLSVAVNGNTIGTDKYTSSSGSTIITLKPAYLKTLDVGQYTLRVNFTDGYAQTRFAVATNGLIVNPQTGDNTNLSLWFMLTIISGLGFIGMIVKKKKAYST